MPAAYPSGSNTFVKDHAASGALVVDFSRNPDDFTLNRYIQIRNVSKESGYYLQLTTEECARILNANLSDFLWYDGNDRPERNEGTESFNFAEFKTTRYDYGYNLGDKAVNQADWDIVSVHSAIKAAQAMTARTQLAITELTNANNFAASHTSDVASISGNTGTWAQSTTARQDIKRSFNHAIKTIKKATVSSVKTEDLVLVIGPDAATEIAESQEFVDHIKGSPEAYAQVRGDLPGRNTEYGIPDKIYGVDIEVEDAVKVTSHKGATLANDFILSGSSAVMVSRPGELVAKAGGPSFSTITCFAFEEMSVETERDSWNRKTKGAVVDDIDMVMTAPSAGYLFTNAV